MSLSVGLNVESEEKNKHIKKKKESGRKGVISELHLNLCEC